MTPDLGSGNDAAANLRPHRIGMKAKNQRGAAKRQERGHEALGLVRRVHRQKAGIARRAARVNGRSGARSVLFVLARDGRGWVN